MGYQLGKPLLGWIDHEDPLKVLFPEKVTFTDMY